MTRKDFTAAAAIVDSIRRDYQTNDPPKWTPTPFDASFRVSSFERAVWTAEAFICLFAGDNPRFDQERFLRACGLVEPAKRGK